MIVFVSVLINALSVCKEFSTAVSATDLLLAILNCIREPSSCWLSDFKILPEVGSNGSAPASVNNLLTFSIMYFTLTTFFCLLYPNICSIIPETLPVIPLPVAFSTSGIAPSSSNSRTRVCVSVTPGPCAASTLGA